MSEQEIKLDVNLLRTDHIRVKDNRNDLFDSNWVISIPNENKEKVAKNNSKILDKDNENTKLVFLKGNKIIDWTVEDEGPVRILSSQHNKVKIINPINAKINLKQENHER